MSDLVQSVDDGFYKLKRGEIAPYEPDFALPDNVKFHSYDYEYPWYMPDTIEYEEVFYPNVLNSMCQSLEYLILNVDLFHSKHTLVPFMLKALPKIKSFGNITLIHALRMIKSDPKLGSISAINLEEMEYVQGGFDYTYRSDFEWASDDIYDMVEEYHKAAKNGENTPEDVLRETLREDVKLIAQECPNLKVLDISLFGEKTYLYSEDDEIWQPFLKLTKLRALTLIGRLTILGCFK